MPASRMLSAISFGVFCRTAPSTSAIMRSRKVEPCAAVMRTLSQSEVTRVPPVTAERSPPLSRITGADSPVIAEFVDRGDALDDLAVARDEVAGLDQHEVARLQAPRRRPARSRGVCAFAQALRLGLGAHAAQRVGLRLAAAFGDRLGEIGEQHGEPQPDGDLAREQRVAADHRAAADEQVAQEEDRWSAPRRSRRRTSPGS